MGKKYIARKNISMVIAIVGWLLLALATRLMGCSPAGEEAPATGADPPRTGGQVPHARNVDGGPDGGLDAGPGRESGEGMRIPILEAAADLALLKEDERMLSSLSMEDPDSSPLENFLLLGMDRSGKLPGRSDAMMIVSARHESGDIGVVSIPRDLWVEIPGAEPGRINKVYRVGNMMHGEGGGEELIRKVVYRELGIRVDHIAAVDFAGFSSVINLLGGIEVDVACPIKDNFVAPGQEEGYRALSLEAGTHLMDGRTALLFSRSRHGRSDMDRARRQQAVLVGLKRRALSFDVIPRLPPLMGLLKKHVDTDIDLAGAFRLVNLARRTDPRDIHGMVLREPLVREWRSKEGKSAVRLNRAAFDKAIAGLFDAPPPGTKERPICKEADVALRWKELARKRKERKRKEKEMLAALAERSPPDAGL